MSNNAWNILKLTNYFYPKFKCNWVPCILSGNPTDRQMQKKKKKRGDWKPLPLVGHTETKNKNNTDNEPKSHYDGYSHRQHHNGKITITTPKAVARKHSRFPQRWFCKCFWETLLIKVPFQFVAIKDKYNYHKDQWARNNGSRSRLLYAHEESLNIV